MQKKDLLSIGEASEYLGVSIDTLRRWEKKRRIEPLRSPGGHRYFTKEILDKLFGKRYTRDETSKKVNEPKITGLKTREPIQEKEDKIASGEIKEEISTFDRPTREVRIPEAKPINIAQVKPLLSAYDAYVRQQSVSILTPPQIFETYQEPQNKSQVNTSEDTKKGKLIIYSLIAFFVILGVIAFLLWSFPRKILSPIP